MKKNTFLLVVLFGAALVFAQNKQSVAVLPSVGDLDPQGLELLTDKVREIASKALPMKDFQLLKLDAIIKRIGEEELYRSCKEGVCIGELARKTSADYGARCDVFKRDNFLVLKFELYGVSEEAIFETFTEYRVKDFYAMLGILEKRLPDAFKKMIDAKNMEAAQPKPAAPPVQPARELPPSVSQAAPTTFVDRRDRKSYRAVEIGNQTWMAQNLNYNARGSKCYGNKPDNCANYGRLYNWPTAMGGASSSKAVPSGVQGVCPAGWHLPSDAEWTMLMDYVGTNAGTKLKSSSYWNSYKKVPTGTDDYGFAALPGGIGYSAGNFLNAGNNGYWWNATEDDTNNAWSRHMDFNYENVDRNNNGKSILFSVRCVRD